MNEQNLTKMGKNRNLSTEEAQKIGSIGGKASAKKRAEKKTFRQIGTFLCEATAKEGEVFDIETIKEVAELKGANLSVKELMIWQQIQKALNGDTKAFEVVRDTMGEKPTDKVEVETFNSDSMKKAQEYLYG